MKELKHRNVLELLAVENDYKNNELHLFLPKMDCDLWTYYGKNHLD